MVDRNSILMSLNEIAPQIELLLSDVDGVMTDGGLSFDENGVETKTFSVRDGLGIKLWGRAGGTFGIITGRISRIVERRAEELGVEMIHQGISDKLTLVKKIAAEQSCSLEQIAYIGDDLPDLPVIRAVGLGIAVADAAEEVRVEADLVTKTLGGRGAVREAVEVILKASGRWQTITDEVG